MRPDPHYNHLLSLRGGWNWEVVRAGGVGTRGERGRAEDNGKEQAGDLKGKIKWAAKAKLSFLFSGLKATSRTAACTPLSPHPRSPRASLVISVPSLPKPSWTPLFGGVVSLVILDTPGGFRMALVDFDER
jgi:hypothetical protein